MSTPSYRQLLNNNADVRNLWLGVLVSFVGDWFSTVALYTLAQDQAEAALAVAWVVIAKTLPIGLMVPVAGPLIDSMDRRRLMVGADLGRCALTLVMMAMIYSGSFWGLVLTLATRVLLTGIFMPCRNAVLPQITNDDELPVAVTLNGGTWSVVLAFAAAAGGLATTFIGPMGAIGLDGLTYLISAVFIARLPALPAPNRSDDDVGMMQAIRALKDPYLTLVLLNKPMLSVGMPALVALPFIAKQAGPKWVAIATGLLYAARGLGAMFGSFGARWLFGDELRRLQWGVCAGFCLIALGGSIGYFSASFPIGLLSFGILGTGAATVWVFTGILEQHAAPPKLKGRLFSLEFGLFMLVSSAASYPVGYWLEHGGGDAQSTMLNMGIVSLLPALLWLIALPFVKQRALKAPQTPPT